MDYLRRYYLIIVILCMTISCVHGEIKKEFFEDAIKYLERFGYLNVNKTLPSDETSAEIKYNEKFKDKYTKQEVENALSDYQDFLGLPKSGELTKITIDTMLKPRCGAKDKSPENFKITWTSRGQRKRQQILQNPKDPFSKSVTLSWIVSPDYLSSTTKITKKIYELMEFAMNMWAGVSNVKFRSLEGTDEADLVISFRKGYHDDEEPFDGPGGVTAHASREAMQIHFDDNESWDYKKKNGFFVATRKQGDFIATAIHEVGHILGLPHSAIPSSIMYALMGSQSIYALHSTDIQNVQDRYGKCWPDRIDSIFSNHKDGRTYIFVGPYVYQLNDNALQVEQTWPRPFQKIFRSNFKYIDDVLINTDWKLYFFSGGEYYRDDGGTPKILKIGKNKNGNVGWNKLEVDKIDAGFLHTDGKVYLFRKDLVYRWDKLASTPNLPHYPVGAVEMGWPKKISEVFPGVPENIDTVFRWYHDGGVYFFKGKYFYIWNEKDKKVVGKYATHQWKNICDVYMCGSGRCTSWAERA